MGETTGIEWTDATWQVTTGCSKVSPGCDHCYALTMSNRLQAMDTPAYRGLVVEKSKPLAWTGEVRCLPERLDDPLLWRTPRRVFVNSMSDLFHPAVPFDFVVKVFDVMAAAHWHTFQVLTKRPGRMAFFAKHVWPKRGGRWEPVDGGVKAVWPGTAWPSNVWAGTSVESAKYLPRLAVLARVPAKVRFVSAEPLLSFVDLRPWLYPEQELEAPFGYRDVAPPPISWVICGAESGPGARPMDIEWARQIKNDCVAAGTPFFLKQFAQKGRKIPMPELDGQVWAQFPEAVKHGD